MRCARRRRPTARPGGPGRSHGTRRNLMASCQPCRAPGGLSCVGVERAGQVAALPAAAPRTAGAGRGNRHTPPWGTMGHGSPPQIPQIKGRFCDLSDRDCGPVDETRRFHVIFVGSRRNWPFLMVDENLLFRLTSWRGHVCRVGSGRVRSRGYSVAKLFCRRWNAIIESRLRMRRFILAEKGAATNQCCAVLPWIEFCNSIGGRPDLHRACPELRLLANSSHLSNVTALTFCAKDRTDDQTGCVRFS